MAGIAPGVVDEVNSIIDDDSFPILQKVDKIFHTLKVNGYGYHQTVLPKETLTHPSNKGGSMLNATDVWEKGLRMLKVGVAPQLLNEGAVAFELATDKTMREQQVAANVKLVKASNNTLASVNFQERFLTVATSHTAAFCKAVEQGVKPGLEEATAIDMKQDPGLQALCTSGWPFFVMRSAVEIQWPELPSYIQSALNVVNNSYQQMTEIEAASQMCQFLKHGLALPDALARVEECDPVCKRSLEAIAYYVSKYAGENQNIIDFLAQFSSLA